MSIDPSRPLRRNTTDAMLGGVCAGLADYLGWDHTLVRVLSVVSILFTGLGPGVILYLVFWLITPPTGVGSSGEQGPAASQPPEADGPGQTGGGI